MNDKKSGLRYDRSFGVKTDALQNVEKMRLSFWFYLTCGFEGCERIHDVGRRLTVDELPQVWKRNREDAQHGIRAH